MTSDPQFVTYMERTFGKDWQDKTIAELLAESPLVPDEALLDVLEYYRQAKAVELSNAKDAEEPEN